MCVVGDHGCVCLNAGTLIGGVCGGGRTNFIEWGEGGGVEEWRMGGGEEKIGGIPANRYNMGCFYMCLVQKVSRMG